MFGEGRVKMLDVGCWYGACRRLGGPGGITSRLCRGVRRPATKGLESSGMGETSGFAWAPSYRSDLRRDLFVSSSVIALPFPPRLCSRCQVGQRSCSQERSEDVLHLWGQVLAADISNKGIKLIERSLLG